MASIKTCFKKGIINLTICLIFHFFPCQMSDGPNLSLGVKMRHSINGHFLFQDYMSNPKSLTLRYRLILVEWQFLRVSACDKEFLIISITEQLPPLMYKNSTQEHNQYAPFHIRVEQCLMNVPWPALIIYVFIFLLHNNTSILIRVN